MFFVTLMTYPLLFVPVGVLPAYNIRTDRWDIAQQAMEAVNQANLAKSKNYGKIEQQEKNALDSKEIGDNSSQQESAG
jgi:hypothetical protein